MVYLLINASVVDVGQLNLVLLFGVIVLGGTFGARLFQRAHIPQVVGCIIIGILLGGDVLGVISDKTVAVLRPFTMFALGVIGFMIGGELRGDVFKKYGKQFFVILFSQGFGAFLLVSAGTSLVSWFITGDLRLSVAIGLVLGAIASATAPAATVNVLWEYKTRGPLTAAILAIVALDDALALLLYRGASTCAEALVGTGHESALRAVLLLLGEILGAIFLGFLAGVVLYYLLKFVLAEDKILGFSISSLLLVVGVTELVGVDPILPAMVHGITIANLSPRQSKGIFELIKKFSPPIYVSFFVLAGAHMRFDKVAGWVLVMIFVYVLLRAAGKVLGSWFGAKYSGAPSAVRKYLGICLLPQAGVAIGLVILASGQFESSLGHELIMIVMMATFLMEVFGPMLVKAGVKGAGEVGLNITEEDLIKTYKVGDVMEREPTSIAEDLPLHQILEVFSTSDSVYYPVINSRSHITGKITISGIKEMFANQDVAGWLLACDVAEPVLDKTTSEKSLEEVVELMMRYDLEYIPVVADEESNKLVGVLDYRRVLRKISAEVLRRRKQADEMALGTG
jgi:Kef-type K+ transport system membrane component KefB